MWLLQLYKTYTFFSSLVKTPFVTVFFDITLDAICSNYHSWDSSLVKWVGWRTLWTSKKELVGKDAPFCCRSWECGVWPGKLRTWRVGWLSLQLAARLAHWSCGEEGSPEQQGAWWFSSHMISFLRLPNTLQRETSRSKRSGLFCQVWSW